MDNTYTGVMQSVITITRSELSNTEFKTLLFIIQRTIRYGKQQERISHRHFSEGVWSRDGDLITVGLGACRKTVTRAIKKLIKIGLIFVEDVGGSNLIKLNVERLIAVNCKIMSKLKQTRKEKAGDKELGEGQNVPRGRGKMSHGGGVKCPPISIHSKVDIEKVDKGDESSSDTVLAGIDKVIEKTKEKNLERLRRRTTKLDTTLTSAGLKAHWNITLREGYPDVPSVTDIPAPSFYKIRSAYNAHGSPLPLREFVVWCIDNWGDLYGGPLAWVDNMTPVPDIFILCVIYKHFVTAYGERDTFKKRNAAKMNAGKNEVTKHKVQANNADKKLRNVERTLREKETELEHYKRIAQTRQLSKRKKEVVWSDEPLAEELPEWEETE